MPGVAPAAVSVAQQRATEIGCGERRRRNRTYPVWPEAGAAGMLEASISPSKCERQLRRAEGCSLRPVAFHERLVSLMAHGGRLTLQIDSGTMGQPPACV